MVMALSRRVSNGREWCTQEAVGPEGGDTLSVRGVDAFFGALLGGKGECVDVLLRVSP